MRKILLVGPTSYWEISIPNWVFFFFNRYAKIKNFSDMKYVGQELDVIIHDEAPL